MNPFSGFGVAFNAVRFDAPAPTDRILAAHTIAPFDDCGGHVNPHEGYHYHAAAGCSPTVASSIKGHAPMIGIALDGYPIAARVDGDGMEPDDLDACRGHFVEGIGYEYRANAVGSNQTLGCLKGETGCVSEDADAVCDATQTRRPPPPDGAPPEGAAPPDPDGIGQDASGPPTETE
jgi:hypothetical protein